MDRWNEVKAELIAHERCSDHLKQTLAGECLSDPEVFEIPRMRTYFNAKFTTAESDLRIDVSYVTAIANVRSPIHAARIYGSIIKHLINKTLPICKEISIQDKVAAQGTVTDLYVTFDIVVIIRRSLSLPKLPNYQPESVSSAKAWRRIYGDRDPYKDSSVSSVTTQSSHSTPATQTFNSYNAPLPDVKDLNLVAVYGSLRKGQPNHDLMRITKPENKFEGKGTTQGELFPLGSYVPGAHFGASYKGKVVVEVYTVDAATMAGLDRLEGWTGKEATSNYVRKTVPVTLENGSTIIVWAYEYPRRAATDIIPGGDWAEHRKQYTPRR